MRDLLSRWTSSGTASGSVWNGSIIFRVNGAFINVLSILIIAFTEAFPAPPVLLYAYYSRPNFAMFGVAMLKDAPRELHIWKVFKNFSQKFGQLCIKWLG